MSMGFSNCRSNEIESQIKPHTKTIDAPNDIAVVSKDANAISPLQFQEIKIQERAFQSWYNHHDFPCVYDSNDRNGLQESKDTGIVFIKLQKCASTTVAQIIQRISNTYGSRILTASNTNSGDQKNPMKCKLHDSHGFAFNLPNLNQRQRDNGKSFLFTFIREPMERFISDFYYHRVSKNNITVSLSKFTKFENHITRHFRGLGGYELPYLLTDRSMVPPHTPEYLFWNSIQPDNIQNVNLLKKRVEYVMQEYDFIGVASRMDESLVVFSILLEIPLTDILYLRPARVKGSYDYDDKRQVCFEIKKPVLTDEMKNYFASDVWKAKMAGDILLFRATNQSLDRTIDNIGRDEFESKLERYREMMRAIQQACGGIHEDFDCHRECTSDGQVRQSSFPRGPRCNIDYCIKVGLSNIRQEKK